MRYNIQYRHDRHGFTAGDVAVSNVEAANEAEAIAQAAKDLRLTPSDIGDHYNETANYGCILQAVPVRSSLNKWQIKEIQTLQKMRHYGPDHIARGLSMLYRCAPRKTQQAEILALATRLGVTNSPEFIKSPL